MILLRFISLFLLSFGLWVTTMTSANSQPGGQGTFFGLDYLLAESTVIEDTDELKPKAVRMRFGGYSSKYLGYETHIATGVSDDQTASNTVLDIDRIYALYARFHYRPFSRLELFALAGIAWTDYTVETPTGNRRDRDGDFSYGGGLMFHLDDEDSITADWVQYLGDRNAEMRAWSIGVLRRY